MSESTAVRPYEGRLNAAQMSVLRWIADGSPDGVMDGYSHRVSAAALKTRGLVTVSGHGPSWRAEVTSRGADYLVRPAATIQTASSDGSGGREREETVMRSRDLSPTEQLIADLLRAGGLLRVPRWRSPGEPDYEQRILAAQRFGKVPAGKRIRTDYKSGELEIRLEDAPDGTDVEVAPVPVPKRVSRLHPAARRFRDQTDLHEVSRAALTRCIRIVHALVTEAESRGYVVANDDQLAISVRDHQYRLRIAEEKVAVRGPWDAETRRRTAVAYPQYLTPRKMRNYDSQATGRLVITIDHGYGREGRPSSFADRKSWTLEDKLPDLLRELEIRAAEDDHNQRQAELRAAERQRQWEMEMERAKVRLLEAHHAKTLAAEITAWQEANVVREYLAALEQAHGDNAESATWIEWVRARSERLDPLSSVPTLPELPEPISPEDLKPYLNGHSPYGPSNW